MLEENKCKVCGKECPLPDIPYCNIDHMSKDYQEEQLRCECGHLDGAHFNYDENCLSCPCNMFVRKD